MNPKATDSRSATIERMVADLFTVDALYQGTHEITLVLRSRFRQDQTVTLLEDRLTLAGYTFRLEPGDTTVTLVVNPKRSLRIPRLNIILFLLTIVSVYVVPVLFRNIVPGRSWGTDFSETLADLANGAGIEFTIALMSMLLIHEMGHFVASRRRDIVTSWPYFIPFPNIIGSMGAVIKSKSPFWNRRDLIEVGASGPIVGWVVALFWLIYGLSNSHIVPASFLGPEELGFFLHGESLLVKFLVPLIVGPAGPDQIYVFSEAAFAGWVGLLVTAINMVPIGQLDGGHIVYGLAGKFQQRLGWAALAMLLVLGYLSVIWWFLAGMGLLFGVKHPPTLNDSRPLGRPALIMGIVALVILLVSFTPVPFPAPF